ncbi:MAG: DUF2975 domain-containing protein [Bacteroidota bacterium]
MKNLGKKSIAKILSAMIQIVWWMEWIGAIAITAGLLIMPFFKKNTSFTTPVTFSAFTIKMVAANETTLQAGRLNATGGNFSFLVPTGLISSLIMILIVVAAFSFFIAATYQLRLIFSSFAKNEPFVEFNTSRIRNLGIILIVYAFAHLIYHIALNEYLTNHFKWASDIRLTYSFNLGALLTGITLIVIAEVFKLGTSLNNEQKLTI